MSKKKKSTQKNRPVQKQQAQKPRKFGLISVISICAVVVVALGIWAITRGTSSPATTGGDVYYADIAIRNYGTVTVKLDPKSAPITTDNFVKLAREGFYDGLTFHRIMEGFMMQGGDPKANGSGGSDTKIKGEFSANGVNNPLSHTRGAISMARSKQMDSASSQFFIVHQDSLFLDGQYAVFGYVTKGMEVVDAVCDAAKPTDNNGTIPRDQQPVIESVTIRTTE